MIKLMGAIIILLSSTLLGMRAASLYVQRSNQLRQLQVALQWLETQIVYGSTPLHEALDHIARRIGGDIQYLFAGIAQSLSDMPYASTRECWEKGIQLEWHKTALKRPEKEILLQLGQILGQSNRDDQQKHIRLALMNLKSEEELARSQQQKYEKMCRSLGVLGGLLMVILLY
jgi:stage III sporulation protein AB